MKLFGGHKKGRCISRAISVHTRAGKPKRRVRCMISLVLVIVLLTGLTIVPALAYENCVKKQEVVYINLKSDGSVDAIYVVNIFDLNESGQIIDYGDYTALRNMTTDDEIQFDSQTVKINTNAKKLYYEGKLNSNVIPWIFDIHYYMDGIEYPADEIAGMSGSLKITMSVHQNPSCNSTFFNHYAIQASFALDTNNCSNIVAEGAMQANVGNNRQLTYTILPGKEKDIAITADVKNFEMDGIAINGISLSLDVDVDVSDNEDINDLQDGAADLDDGANKLNDGTAKLEDGAAELVDKLKDLNKGADELNDGANELKDGADTLFDGVTNLDDGAGDLLDGADDLADGSETLYDGASSVDDGAQALYDGAKELDDGIAQLKDGAKDVRSGAGRVASGASSLDSGLSTLTSKNSTIQTMSTTLYNTALEQYSDLLSAGGYTVTADSTSEELADMMEQRQAELTGDSQQTAATQAAISTRMATLSEIAENADGSHTEEEVAAAQSGINYWNMTLAIQGEQAYQTVLSNYGEESADASDYADAHTAYNSYVAYYGGADAFMAAYEALSEEVGDSEQAAVTAIVTESLSDTVTGDDIYKTLAVLAYYKGIIDYTDRVASAASGADSLSWGADSLYDGADELYTGAKALQDGSANLLDGIKQLMDGTAELKDGTLELHDGTLTLKDGVITLKDGTEDLLDGVTDLQDGTVTLCDGTVSLCDGTVALLDGAIELHDGTIKLHDGTVDLVDGTIELCDKTSDASLNEKIQQAIDDAMGTEDFTPVSFVSNQNTDVDSVQFVIKTPDIAVEEADEVEPAAADQLNLWQKFLNLFGFYHAD